MAGDLDPSMVDAHLVTAHHDADLSADQSPRYAVMVRVHIHAGVVLHPAAQLAQLPKWRTGVQWAQGRSLLALKARDRHLASRPVHPHVSHFAHPPARCASSSPHDAKLRPAMALFLT